MKRAPRPARSRPWPRLAAAALPLALAACPPATQAPGPSTLAAPAPETPAALTSSALTPAEAARRERALAARDALAKRLLGALEARLAAEGPPAAIEACATLAPALAREVAAEHGLAIGRTSWRLRSQANRPPAWAAPLLEGRPEVEVLARLPGGALGVLLPIRVAPACTQCHGGEVAPTVREALARRYPDDQATGFAPGDLRGWFWVEVQ